LALATCCVRRADAEPLRLRGDAITETQSPAGLIVLQGEDKIAAPGVAPSVARGAPLLSAEGLVWAGARPESTTRADATGDVLVLAMKLREPHGWGEARAGRFVVATGAIRPLQLDGADVIARAPTGTTLETFGGAPVVPRFGDRAYDWALGGRASQSIFERATVGVSYLQRRTHGEESFDELGADAAIVPVKWLDVAARGAYSLDSPGIVDSLASVAARVAPFRFELFASHRSPSRLLPATSLFSVLGDFPSDTIGTTAKWAAAPRLDLFASAAAQSVGGSGGGNAFVRATLRTDDRGAGSLGLEARRQDVSTAQFTGVRGAATQPLGHGLRYSTEIEIAVPDHPEGRGIVWPWALMALAWRSPWGFDTAAAVEAAATPTHRFETNALVRLSYPLELR
jgi:hypothetical protein